ncbi:unnamed protein product, partial [Urochloa humidicola]
KGSRKTKAEKVQISCRRWHWKENRKMQKVQTAWSYGKKHAMNMFMILMHHHLPLQSQKEREPRQMP